jgi:DNA mismatch repair protein MutH
MDRKEAIRRIGLLKGQDLRTWAETHHVVVFKEDGKLNKGWAGHVIERFLGIPLNSSRSPNFGSWELKVIPLFYDRHGRLRIKETMAVCMLDSVEVTEKPFEESHFFNKLRKILIVSRIYEGRSESRSFIYGVHEFDLEDSDFYQQIKEDYDLIRQNLLSNIPLSGKMGVFIQPRTKGPGHGSVSRAFYARKALLSRIVGVSP